MKNNNHYWPEPLTGLKRTILDIKSGITFLGWLLTNCKKKEMTFRDAIRAIKRAIVISNALTEYKQVRFGNRVFFDAFSPPWPDKTFHRMLANTGVKNDFTPNALIAITNRCINKCKHCYAVRSLRKEDVLSDHLILETVEKMCQSGVGVLSLEGGEPLLRYELVLKALNIIGTRATPVIATTGWGLDESKANELAKAGLVAAQISLDHYIPQKHNEFRGNPKAFDVAVKAVEHFRKAGIFPILAFCAVREMIEQDQLFRYLEFAKEIGAGMIQLLDPLPSGNYLHSGEDSCLTPAEIDRLLDFHRLINTDPKYKNYPGVCARAHIEHESRFGCGMGGNGHYAIDPNGNVLPCVYIQMSVGNIMDEDLNDILLKMRSMFPKTVGGLCPAYELSKPISECLKKGVECPVNVQYTKGFAELLMKRNDAKIVKKLAPYQPSNHTGT